MRKYYKIDDISTLKDVRFNIERARYKGDFTIPRHKHSFVEMILICSGTGTHFVNGKAFDLRAGDVIILNEGTEHEVVNGKKVTLYNIIYIREDLFRFAGDIFRLPGFHALFFLQDKNDEFRSHINLPGDKFMQIESIAERIFKEVRAGVPGHGSMAISLFMQIVILLSRFYEDAKSGVNNSNWSLSRALACIETALPNAVSIDELCSEAHVSRALLYKMFQENFAVPPGRFILEKRMEIACELLRNTGGNVTEVSQQTGFSDSNYFSRQFKLITGVSPRKYQQLMKKIQVI